MEAPAALALPAMALRRMRAAKEDPAARMGGGAVEDPAAIMSSGGSVSSMAASLRKVQRANAKAESASHETEAQARRRSMEEETAERERNEEAAQIEYRNTIRGVVEKHTRISAEMQKLAEDMIEAMERLRRADVARRRHEEARPAIEELESASGDSLLYLTWATGSRFKVLRGESTMPVQSARYCYPDDDCAPWWLP